MRQFYRQYKPRLPKYFLSVFNDHRFLSRSRLFQLPVAFLGVHCRALVFYSDGEIVSRLSVPNIQENYDFEVCHGLQS